MSRIPVVLASTTITDMKLVSLFEDIAREVSEQLADAEVSAIELDSPLNELTVKFATTIESSHQLTVVISLK